MHDDTWTWLSGPAPRRIALRLGMSSAEADEVVQDAAMKLVVAGETPRVRSLSAWFRRVVRNLAIDRMRSDDRRRRREEALSASWELAGPSPVDIAAGHDLARHIQTALQELPDSQRDAVWLVDGEGYGFAEAAERLGVRPGTVASRVARGRARLRELLAEQARLHGLLR